MQRLTSAPKGPVQFTATAEDRDVPSTGVKRILIVEDDYFVALEVEHHLTQAGFVVVGIAATAEQALDLAVANKPVLAIMDIRLAGRRDGVDTAIELSSSHGIPSIFATAHCDTQTKKRAELAKPLGWLQKPYSSDSLIALVHEVLLRT